MNSKRPCAINKKSGFLLTNSPGEIVAALPKGEAHGRKYPGDNFIGGVV